MLHPIPSTIVTLSRKCCRLTLLASASLLWASVLPQYAFAESAFPNKQISLVVSFAPGGPTDLLARMLADKMQKSLNQTIIVDNSGGGGGNIGAARVAKAEPDGHTILIGIDSIFTVNPYIYPSMRFQSDLKPVMILASQGLAVAVPASSQATTLMQLVENGKKRSLTFSSAGNGSPGHLAASMLADATGVQVSHIPYKGNAPAVTAVVSAEVDAAIIAMPGLLPHHKTNRVKILGTTGQQRSPALPEVATTAELGFSSLALQVYQVAMVPAKTPEAVVAKLQSAMAAALAGPDVQEKLRGMDLQPMDIRGAKADELLTKTRERYALIIKSTGMKAD